MTTLTRIIPLSRTHTITFYTEGSVDDSIGAAGPAFVCNGVTRKWRVSDGAFSKPVEMVGIKGALQHALTVSQQRAFIATDSEASLQALRHTDPVGNMGLISQIHHLAQAIGTAGTKITLVWIPGQANIRGNELSDCRGSSREP